MTAIHIIAEAAFCFAGFLAIVAIYATVTRTKGWRE